MKVKELKEILNKVDGNLEVIVLSGEQDLSPVKFAETITFTGACDEEGNLLPNAFDKVNDVEVFVIEI